MFQSVLAIPQLLTPAKNYLSKN